MKLTSCHIDKNKTAISQHTTRYHGTETHTQKGQSQVYVSKVSSLKYIIFIVPFLLIPSFLHVFFANIPNVQYNRIQYYQLLKYHNIRSIQQYKNEPSNAYKAHIS